MIRATLDTNVYISALAFRGKPMELLHLANEGQVQVSVSDAILDETARVLGGERFQWSAERVRDARAVIADLAEHVTPTQPVDVVKDDPTDNPILECAVEAGSDYVVTGDRHLLRLKRYGAARIVSVADFISLAVVRRKSVRR